MKTVVGDQLDPGRGALFEDKCGFSVRFVVPFDRVDEFISAVKPFSCMIRNHGSKHRWGAPTQKQEARIKIIQNSLVSLGWVRIGALYKKCRRSGYLYSYKSFQRDVCVMGVLGFVETLKSTGGKHGNTTIIRLKEDGACSQVPVE